MVLKYSIVIPAFNEEKTIAKAIRETVAVFGSLNEGYEIIVVDDGSKDATVKATEELTREYPFLKIVKHEVNRGKGEAVRTGVAAAVGEYVLFVDADLATHPAEARSFLPRLGKNRILIGSRTADGAIISSPQPLYRIWGGWFINFLVRKVVGLPYRDTQCGFKMFNREVGQKLFSEMTFSRWLFDVELIARARADGYEIIEIPVRWNHGETSRVKFGEVLKELPRLSHLRCLIKRATKNNEKIMKLITIINPENVSEDEVKNYEIRNSARAVVYDSDGNIAILNVTKKNYHKLPGGGVEEGEDLRDALKRECQEEIGCEIEIFGEIGQIIEYRKTFKIKQISFCYLAKVIGEKGSPKFTEDESKNGFEILWLPLKQVQNLFETDFASNDVGKLFIVPRDKVFLKQIK